MGERFSVVVGLVGAAGALEELKTTAAVLAETRVDWSAATAGTLSRPIRLVLTLELELQGAKRVPGAVIGQLLKQRLLDGAAAALGMLGSSLSGVIHEIVVWVTDETNGMAVAPQ